MKKLNLIKRLLPCLLAIVCVFTLASCKKDTSHLPYPSVSPTIDNPEQAFITIGNYKVTNEAVYAHLVQSYGLDELNTWIEKVILGSDPSVYDNHYSDEAFKVNLDQIIYGVDPDDNTKADIPEDETEKQKILDEFAEEMRSLGLTSQEAWENYYHHEYVKMAFAVKAFKDYVKEYNDNEDNEENYFTEDDYKNYYESLHRSKIEAIILTFDSEKEAKAAMKAAGVVLENLNSEWTTNNGKSVKEVFEAMNLALNGKAESTVYEYDELKEISSTITSRLVSNTNYSTEEGVDNSQSYTHGPQSFGSRFYLALKLDEQSDGSTPYEDLTDTEKDEIFHALVEQSLSNDYITKALNEEKNKLSLKIYDQGLETSYVSAYDAAYTALSISEYDEYKVTYEESSKIVASFEYNGKTYELSAQQLFETLTSKYGAIISLLLLQQYVVLTNTNFNSVYDYVTGEVLNQTKYDEFYKSDIQEYKDSFEDGSYEENGYPSTYGWNNFLKDYLGVLDEKELMFNLDGSLYSYAKTKLERTLWVTEIENTDEEGNTTTTYDDTAVQEKMQQLVKEYFSANIIGAMAYYDKNFDGIADELPEGQDTDSLAAALVNKVYEIATEQVKKNQNINKTLEEALQETAVSYKLADASHSVWGTYKAAGLRLSIVTTTSYSSTSSIKEPIKQTIKELWDKVNNYDELTNEEGKTIGTKITGQSLDPGYHYVKNDTGYFVSALDFTSDVFFYSQSDDENSNVSTAYKLSIIKGTAPSYTDSTTKEVSINVLDYDEYIESGTSTKSSEIVAFYTPAINSVLSINNVSNAKTLNEILDLCKSQLEKTTWTNGSYQDEILKLINDGFVVEED